MNNILVHRLKGGFSLNVSLEEAELGSVRGTLGSFAGDTNSLFTGQDLASGFVLQAQRSAWTLPAAFGGLHQGELRICSFLKCFGVCAQSGVAVLWSRQGICYCLTPVKAPALGY